MAFVTAINKLTSAFYVSVLLVIMNFVIISIIMEVFLIKLLVLLSESKSFEKIYM